MGIRDDEIVRLTKYAEGLGIKVEFKKPSKTSGAAEWCMTTRTITLYDSPATTRTSIILSFLHELGHHLDWIYNNKKDSSDAFKAYSMLNDGNMHGERLDIPKKYREIILQEELSGIHYMDILHKELDLKIPLWKVKMQQELDAYDYKMLCNHGRFSTREEYLTTKNNIMQYYKDKYGKRK